MICLKIRTFVVSATTILHVIRLECWLWFAWKFVPLWYQQQPFLYFFHIRNSCDLLENSYLCGISNNVRDTSEYEVWVVICLKIRTFVVSATTYLLEWLCWFSLWFAWKFVPLWYQQQLSKLAIYWLLVVICLKIRTFVVSATTKCNIYTTLNWLWFAWKFVPLWYQQQQYSTSLDWSTGCDLLENSYLCGISNNLRDWLCNISLVVICLKIRTFVVSATTLKSSLNLVSGCDLLENSYLCGISNNLCRCYQSIWRVVICLKIRTFVVSATTRTSSDILCDVLWFAWKFVPLWYQQQRISVYSWHTNSCDLLENSYLCGISNNAKTEGVRDATVVICLKIRTFVVSATTVEYCDTLVRWLWFAWKFVPLWYQQQLSMTWRIVFKCCDLLENSYLCGISNNVYQQQASCRKVVICLKIRTFVVSATTFCNSSNRNGMLWFAWKFVPLWYQQQLILDIVKAMTRCDLLENSYLCGISNNSSFSALPWLKVVICLKIRTFVVSATTLQQ